MSDLTYAQTWLMETAAIVQQTDVLAINALVGILVRVRREQGRVFVLGIGGSAANASHCVNDLRVRGKLEAYAPTDNVAELTARINDSETGWELWMADWLRESHVGAKDLVLVFSVSGETEPLVEAVAYAKTCEASVAAVLGTKASEVEEYCDAAVIVPCLEPAHRAGQAEALQAVVWHAVVSDPRLRGENDQP